MTQTVETAYPKKGLRALVLGSVLQLFLGIIYVWSVFVAPVSEHLGWAADEVKLTSSYMLCCFVLGILAGGKLQTLLGTAKVTLIGGLLMAIGMLAASFTPAGVPQLIYFTYGVTGGLGVGIAYNAVISCAQRWFPKKRGLATGVSVCAFGFSTVIFAPLVEALIAAIGVANTFRVLAAAFCLVTAALFRFIELPPETQGAAASGQMAGRQYTTGQILLTKEFYYITLSLMLGTAAYFILNPSFKTLAQERGLDPAMGTAIVMITGIANALGRLAVPVLSDKIGRAYAALSILAATALCSVLLMFAPGALFMACVAVIAFCYGGYSGIYPLLTGDAFGMKNIGSNYGAVMVGFALSALFFPMIIGAISDVSTKFIVLAALAAVGGILAFLLAKSKPKAA